MNDTYQSDARSWPDYGLKHLHVHNFKSLVDFKLDLHKTTCLVGLNGAGKSTILQAVDFIAQQMKGDLTAWLSARGWDASDLNSRLSTARNINFKIEGRVRGKAFEWSGTFNRSSLRCTREELILDHNLALKVDDGRYAAWRTLNDQQSESLLPLTSINLEYEGSILSHFKESVLSEELVEFKRFIASIASLDALSPQNLRKRARSSSGGVGHAGEQLSAFVHAMPAQRARQMKELLSRNYPHLIGVETSSLKAGWKALKISEKFDGLRFSTDSRHINDGMLRLMAIIAESLSEHGFLLFDEIENGINPELVEFLLDYLVSIPQQVMVTTHSPLILNYLENDVARKGVMFVYKKMSGTTRAIPLFAIPSMSKKLKFMGPGEVYADTQLTKLPQEIAQLPFDH